MGLLVIAASPSHGGFKAGHHEQCKIAGQVPELRLGRGDTQNISIPQSGSKIKPTALALIKVRVQNLAQILIGNQLSNLGAESSSVLIDLTPGSSR